MAFRDGKVKLTDKVKCFVCGLSVSNKEVLKIHMRNHERDEQTQFLTDLEDVFGMEARPLFPGAVFFVVPPRLARDMTDSTDWNLIYAPRRTIIRNKFSKNN